MPTPRPASAITWGFPPPEARLAGQRQLWAVHFLVNARPRDIWGRSNPDFGAVMDRVRNMMLVPVFVFIGIEGASVPVNANVMIQIFLLPCVSGLKRSQRGGTKPKESAGAECYC